MGSPLKTELIALAVGVALLVGGCSQVCAARSTARSVARAADAGVAAFYARHPSPYQSELEAATGAFLALSEAFYAGCDPATADRLVSSYISLHRKLKESGILDGKSPFGGAESNAPSPKKLSLPTPEEFRDRILQAAN